MSQNKLNIKIISAGAGSGKTYRLTNEMVKLLKSGVKPSGIIATTFTNKAAAELQERVRVKLLEDGMPDAANELANALIGTVHSIGTKLLKRFAFEAGVSPEIEIIADEDRQILFNKSLANTLTQGQIGEMSALAERLGLNKKKPHDWRGDINRLVEIARMNAFSVEVLERSKKQSIETLFEFLGPKNLISGDAYNIRIAEEISIALETMTSGEDATKATGTVVRDLKSFQNKLKNQGFLNWYEWAKISKIKPGAKSREAVEKLREFAGTVEAHPHLRADLENFIELMFTISIDALNQYESFKKQRGLIDYTDMEVEVKKILENKNVCAILQQEIDLLMVDEFQDTSPLQLDMFLRLSKIAKHNIWVGDPKQSIYGFRGAEPRLMQAIIQACGGVKPEDIQKDSWRSRQDIVHACNVIFNKAFAEIPNEQISLSPKRRIKANDYSSNNDDEPANMGRAVQHWHFHREGGTKRAPNKQWADDALADKIRHLLDEPPTVFDKELGEYRTMRPGDIAILCRANFECESVAKSLHKMGLKSAISRKGLLQTAEVKLVMACLKFIQNKNDELSIAELLLLASRKHLEDIIDDRLNFLEEREAITDKKLRWAEQDQFIGKLNQMRRASVEMSSAEILNLVLEELDLRRVIVAWGRVEQRLDNIDVLRKFALQYEDACRRMHTAATLGGFLLWLNELSYKKMDSQGSGAGPNAINILTYHKSKGLEWPMVIAHKLNANLRDQLWGCNIVPESDAIDLDDILKDRWLRFWVNPYADQSKGTILETNINESEAKKIAQKAAAEEEVRLLYVGLTRARDYLVFPCVDRTPTTWLNRVWHGNADTPTLDEHNDETQWVYEEEILYKETKVETHGVDIPAGHHYNEDILFQQPAAGQTETHKDLMVKDDDDPPIWLAKKPKTGVSINYSSAPQLQDEADKSVVVKLLHYISIAFESAYPAKEKNQLVKSYVEKFDAQDMIKDTELQKMAVAFYEYIAKNWSPKQLYKAMPIQYEADGKRYESVIDFVVDTGHSLILIQNNLFVGDDKILKNEALGKSIDMAWKRKVIKAIFNKDKILCFVHFPMHGSLIEIEIEDNLFS